MAAIGGKADNVRECPLFLTQSGSLTFNFSETLKNSTDVVKCRPGSRVLSRSSGGRKWLLYPAD